MGKPKLTEAEKLHRRLARKAEAMNAAQVKQFGPLFAHLAPVAGVEDAARHVARTRANMVEHLHTTPAGPGVRGLAFVRVQQIEDYARTVCGELFEPFRAAMHRTYGTSVGYFYTFWVKALTGEPVLVGYDRQDDPAAPLGVRVTKQELRLDPAPLTREEFYARFPYTEPTHYGQGEPASAEALFAEIMAKLAG